MAAPQLRFKEFDGDWECTLFQDASIQIIDGDRGNNYPKSDDFYDDEFCLFLNAGNVTKAGFQFEKTQFIKKEKDSLLRKGKLQRNDLVVTTRGTVGNVAFFNDLIPFKNIRINSGMVVVRTATKVLPIFLNQFFTSDLFEKWLEKNTFGSAQPQLTVKLLNTISLTYPSISEQTKIASFLSTVDEKISQLTQKHELLSQYKQGMMQKLFSQQIRFIADDGSEFGEWARVKFKDILISYRLGGNYSNSENKTPYPLIKMGNLGRGTISTNKIEYIPCEEKIDVMDLIKTNDLFFNTRNTLDLVGKVAIWRDELPHAYYNSNLMRLEFENNIFMNYLLNERTTLEKLKSIASGTTSVAAIYTKDLLKINLEIPCLEEQIKIANFLTAIDQKIEVVAQQIEQAKTWKKGLLQQMFV